MKQINICWISNITRNGLACLPTAFYKLYDVR